MRIILFLFLVIINSQQLSAQTEEATTKSGKKVVLYPDGTWKYAEESKPKAEKPVEKQQQKTAVIPESKPAFVTGNCENIIERIDTKKAGVTELRTRNMIIAADESGNKEINILFQKNTKGIITIFFKPVGAGDCIDEGSKVNIVYEDDSKTEFKHDGFANCNREISAGFGGNFGRKKQLEELSSKKIKTVKVRTQNGTAEIKFSAQNQEEFLKAINCIANN